MLPAPWGQAEPPTARIFLWGLPKSHNQHIPSPQACCCDGGFLAACRQHGIATGKSRAEGLWSSSSGGVVVSKCHWFPFRHVLLFGLHLFKTKLHKTEIRRKYPNCQARKTEWQEECVINLLAKPMRQNRKNLLYEAAANVISKCF